MNSWIRAMSTVPLVNLWIKFLIATLLRWLLIYLINNYYLGYSGTCPSEIRSTLILLPFPQRTQCPVPRSPCSGEVPPSPSHSKTMGMRSWLYRSYIVCCLTLAFFLEGHVIGASLPRRFCPS